MLGLSDPTERFYSHGILLSIPKYLLSGKRAPPAEDKSSDEAAPVVHPLRLSRQVYMMIII